LATGEQVLAAGSAAAQSASSGGGVPWLAGIGAYMGALINAVFFPLVVFFGTVSGAWNVIRNSPTLRSRRFMLKATLFQTMVPLSFGAVFLTFAWSFMLLLNDRVLMSMTLKYGDATLYVTMVFIGLYCVISSYEINRRWRKIVEEDRTQPTNLASLERSSLSLRSLRMFLCCWMAVPCIIMLIFTIVFFSGMMLASEEHLWKYQWIINGWYTSFSNIRGNTHVLPPFVAIFTLLIFYWVIERRVVDEASLTVWQPTFPNYLQVLTGEEKPKSGLRYRTNFWSDILLVGVGLCIHQGVICANYFSVAPVALGYYYLAVFVISFIAYLLFAMFFAGIPRRRYFGYIYLGSFIAILNTVFVLLVEPWLYHRLGVATPIWHADGQFLMIVLFWLFCFVMSGVAGLYVFRKRKNGQI
jgi:hypothetical protein